jgi:hypothetical protein
MADGDNIIRLAELQDSGKDISTTEDAMALVCGAARGPSVLRRGLEPLA